MDVWLPRAKLKCVSWSVGIKEVVCDVTCRYNPKEQSIVWEAKEQQNFLPCFVMQWEWCDLKKLKTAHFAFAQDFEVVLLVWENHWNNFCTRFWCCFASIHSKLLHNILMLFASVQNCCTRFWCCFAFMQNNYCTRFWCCFASIQNFCTRFWCCLPLCKTNFAQYFDAILPLCKTNFAQDFDAV